MLKGNSEKIVDASQVCFIDLRIDLSQVSLRMSQLPPWSGPAPVQLILMGCPGSGKSHALQAMATTAKIATQMRTTFHDEITYGDFVGAYKPVPLFIDSTTTTYDAGGQEIKGILAKKVPSVMYQYQPGILVNAYVQAILNPAEKVVLIIEEINRANPAVIFGDFLQLLDRDDDGQSEYAIQPSADLSAHLYAKFAPVLGEENSRTAASLLQFPGNLLIWGTMNRADQSVKQIDSAFLRRWNIQYLSYDAPCAYDTAIVEGYATAKTWAELRGDINKRLCGIGGIEDDKFVGPYFLKRSELADRNKVFSKLITYLWYDVVSMERDELFEDGSLGSVHKRWMAGEHVLKL